MLAVSSSIYPCYYPACHKTFATKFNLRRHVNSSHLEIKNYTCPLCCKKFACKQNLNEHHYIHTGEKPFQCTFPGCLKKFRQASQLCIHKKIHMPTHNSSLSQSYFCDIKLTALLALQPTPIYTVIPSSVVVLPSIETQKEQEDCKLPVLPALINLKLV